MKAKSKYTGILTITLLAILVASIAVIAYWDKKIWSFAEYVSVQRQALYNERSAIQFLSKVDSEIKQTKEYSSFLNEFYVSGNSMLAFIEKLEKMAKTSGVQMQIQNVSQSDKKPNSVDYVGVTLQTTGSWENVNKFVKLVENMPYFISIKVLHLSSSGLDAKQWTASMTIITMTK